MIKISFAISFDKSLELLLILRFNCFFKIERAWIVLINNESMIPAEPKKQGDANLDRVGAKSILSIADGVRILAKVTLQELLADSPLSQTELNSQEWISWHHLTEWIDWIDQSRFGPMDWEKVGEEAVQSRYYLLIRPLVRMTLSIRLAYWLSAKWFGPSQFRGISSKFEDLGPREIQETLTIHKTLKACPQLFEIFQGTLAVLPQAIFGSERATIVASISDRSAVYQIILPPEVWVWNKARFFFQSLFNVRSLFREMVSQQESLQAQSGKILLERSEFKNLIQRFPDGLLIHNNQIIRYINSSMAHFLNCKNSNILLGKNLIELIHVDDREAVLSRIAHFAKFPYATNPPVEFRFYCQDSKEIFVGECTALQTIFEGTSSIAVVVRDVSDLKKLQAHMILTDRMRGLGQLAAGVGHEINNPLFYLMMKAEKLSKSLDTDGLIKERNQVAEIQAGLSRIESIVRQLKTFSRTDEEENKTLVDVTANLKAAIGMARNTIEHRARLHVEIDPFLPPVLGTESRLGQVFLNLLINAAQAIEPGNAEQNLISISASTDPTGFVVIGISDTGRGIPENVRKNIFRPFYTTKPVGEGTGLGLSICHSIVNSYGGSIRFETETGVGTLFQVYFPVAKGLFLPSDAQSKFSDRSPQASKIFEPTAHAYGSSETKVLLIDDDRDLLEVLESVIAVKHQVKALTDAAKALEVIAEGNQFDCILCDLMMPKLGGVDFYERLLKISPEHCQRIVFMTGGSFTAKTDQFLKQENIVHREKPISTLDLMELIQNTIDRSTREANH